MGFFGKLTRALTSPIRAGHNATRSLVRGDVRGSWNAARQGLTMPAQVLRASPLGGERLFNAAPGANRLTNALAGAGYNPQNAGTPGVNPALTGAVANAFPGTAQVGGIMSGPKPMMPQQPMNAGINPRAGAPASMPAPAAPAPAAPGMTYEQAKAQFGAAKARQMQAAGQVSG